MNSRILQRMSHGFLALTTFLLIAAPRAAAAPILVVGQEGRPKLGTGSDQALSVKTFVYSNGSYSLGGTIKPFPKTFAGGVRVAVGDVDGDFVPELIVAAGPGSLGPRVQVYSLNTESGAIAKPAVSSFLAFEAKSKNGVTLRGSTNSNSDFVPDLVVGAGKNSSEVKVLNSSDRSAIINFFAFETTLKGGVNLALGDFNGDFISDIITGSGPGGGPHVRVFNGQSGAQLNTAIGDFYAYDQSFQGGVRVAVGDVNGDGIRDIITGPVKGAQSVKVFSGSDGSLVRQFSPYNSNFRGGLNVAAGDIDGDGRAEVIVGASSGKLPVKVFDGATGSEELSFYPFGPKWSGGVTLYQF